GDAARRDTLRHLLAAVKQVEVDTRKELSDADVEQVLTREAKRRRESIESFQKGGRADLVSKEQGELQLIESYLPQQMSRPEIEALARQAIAETGAQSPAQVGAVMQRLMPQVKGKADGKLVNQVVRELLAQ
ncbi:MAG: GatB/YqeY domain-containing protein, partial [Chloroflexi bacterium]